MFTNTAALKACGHERWCISDFYTKDVEEQMLWYLWSVLNYRSFKSQQPHHKCTFLDLVDYDLLIEHNNWKRKMLGLFYFIFCYKNNRWIFWFTWKSNDFLLHWTCRHFGVRQLLRKWLSQLKERKRKGRAATSSREKSRWIKQTVLEENSSVLSLHLRFSAFDTKTLTTWLTSRFMPLMPLSHFTGLIFFTVCLLGIVWENYRWESRSWEYLENSKQMYS